MINWKEKATKVANKLKMKLHKTRHGIYAFDNKNDAEFYEDYKDYYKRNQ